MRVMRFIFAVATGFLLTHEAVLACSICRCGDQSFFLNNARQLSAGRLLLGIEHFNTRKDALTMHHEEGVLSVLAKRSVPARAYHEEVLEAHAQNLMQINVKYGLTNRVMLMASLPYAFNRITAEGAAESTNGLGDPDVLVLARLLGFGHNAWSLQGLGGARFPLGASDQNDDTGARLDQHLQSGSGAWAGTFGLQLIHSVTTVPLFFGASYQVNGTNDHEFAYGNVFRFDAAAQKALSGSFDMIAEVNGRVAGYDHEEALRDENSGGTMVCFSPGLRLRFGGAFSLRSQVQIPVVENLHGEQDEKVNMRTGFVWEL